VPFELRTDAVSRLSAVERTQRTPLPQRPPSDSRLNDGFHLANEAMNLGKVIGGLGDFDDRHDLGKSFARSHVSLLTEVP
jgi:hypothetical protein